MAALESFSIPGIEAALTAAADLLNSVYLPAATSGSVVQTAAITTLVLALVWVARRVRAKAHADTDVRERIDDLCQRLQTTELLLADASGEALKLRQRVDELTARQEIVSAGNARSGLRQAIALSKHGATIRQLIDTCDLSQGEAHLIQTLYGRPPGPTQADELH